MGGADGYVALDQRGRPDPVKRLIVIEATSYSGGTDESWLSRWPLPFPDLETAHAFFISQEVDARVWSDVLAERDGAYMPEFSDQDIQAASRFCGRSV